MTKRTGQSARRVAGCCVVLTAALLAAAMLAGCSILQDGRDTMGQSDGAESIFEYRSGVAPTEAQEEVARDLGCTSAQIEKMRQEGMSAEDWQNIVPAEAMISYLEGRYGVSFEARSMEVPWTLGSDYTLTFEAEEGPWKWRECRVSAWEGENGETNFTDTYFALVKQDEYAQVVGGLLEDCLVQDCGIDRESFAMQVTLDGSYDASHALDEDVQSRLSEYLGSIAVFVDSASGADDTTCEAAAEKVGQVMGGTGASVSFEFALVDMGGRAFTFSEAENAFLDAGGSWSVVGAV